MENMDEQEKYWLREVGKNEVLPWERQADLFAEYAELAKGRMTERKEKRREEIRSSLITSNLRLVLSIALGYRSGDGMALGDLVQEGSLGLMKAVDKFDLDRGFLFTTYATWWIHQSIQRAIAGTDRTIRLPVNVRTRLRRLVRIEGALLQRLGRAPTEEELAVELGCSVEKVRVLKQAGQTAVSLQKSVGNDGDAALEDFVADETLPSADASLGTKNTAELIGNSLDDLTVREREIIQYRYGISA